MTITAYALRCTRRSCRRYIGRFEPTTYRQMAHYTNGCSELRCVACRGGHIEVNPIHGVRTATDCDERCMTAEGSKCYCGCGGNNHGKLA